MPSGIATRYGGSRFRSRLEARWARFFDLVGWKWDYEPFDAEGWIPDFLVLGDTPFLVEVGPLYLLSEFSKKAGDGALQYVVTRPELPTLILGVAPNALYGAGRLTDVAGYLTTVEGRAISGLAMWGRCGECRAPYIVHDGSRDWIARPCGHQQYGLVQGFTEHDYVPLWRDAGNRVQWRAPAA